MHITLFQFLSQKKQTPFAPEWNYILGETVAEDIDFSIYETKKPLLTDKEEKKYKIAHDEKNSYNWLTYIKLT